MEKLLFIMIIFTSILFSQVSYTTVSIDSGATVSDTISISPQSYIVGLIIPNGLTDTLYINAGFLQGGELYPIYNLDSTQYVIVIDSSKTTAIIIHYEDLQAFRFFSFTSSVEATETKNIIILFKEE